ncbi:Uncharacterised protein [Raoultella terrigena]|uniref:Uncharacterized protein n=1 Tax=Raoultella terrigena TaxID=577 RepID=A0A3P8KFM9_RAOTE|nr:Uncharacterised protein [Raoultella terrigena]
MPLLNVRDLTIGLDPRSTLVKASVFTSSPEETLA